MFGAKKFPNVGYPTPEELPDQTTCLQLNIPADVSWWAIYVGLLFTLTSENAWQQFDGGMSREDAAAAALEVFTRAMEHAETSNDCDVVPTPFWDTPEDVGEERSIEDQPWYGYVENAEAPPGEITFVENAIIWAFTGFLAVGVDVNLAIAFHTIAPRFHLAMKAGDIGEIIRIIIDGEEAARVDTSGRAGEIIDTRFTPAPSDDGHQIYIMKVS